MINNITELILRTKSMEQIKEMSINNAVIDNFGHTIIPGELVGFYKRITGNKVFIYGKYDYLENDKLHIITFGFKTDFFDDSEELKKRIKKEYINKDNSKFYKIVVKKTN